MRIAANARDHTLGDPRARYPLAVLFWLGLLGPAVVVAVGHSPLTGVAVALAGLLGAIGVGTACAGRAALRWIPVAAAPLIGIGCAFGAHALL